MIDWTIGPEIFSLGPLSIRWYGLLFAFGFIVGFQIMAKIFKEEGKPENDLNDLLWYMIIGTVIGARLGHCIFYNPDYYFTNPMEIIKIWKGGLASHGAAIGILIAIYTYSKKKKGQPFLWVMDRIVITVALAGSFIRLGNLFNSEIVGIATNSDWGFIFHNAHVSDPLTPRHPAQLYESIAYLFVFIVLAVIYRKTNGKFKQGFLFGLFCAMIFSFRFLIEFVKENQSMFEAGMAINMGQILSIPLVLAGLYFIFRRVESK